MQTHFNDFEMWQLINKRLTLFAVQDGEYKFCKSEIRKQTEIRIIINELNFLITVILLRCDLDIINDYDLSQNHVIH